MRTALFVGALALGSFGTSVHAAPGATLPAAREQPKPSQLLLQAEGLVGKIASQLNDNRVLQSQARNGRDSLRLGCVENQLVTSRALVDASEGTITSLRATVRSAQDVQAATLYSVLVTLADESDATHRAAAACLGFKELAQKAIDTPLPLPVRAAPGGNGGGGGLGLDDHVPLGAIFGPGRVAPASP